MVRGAWIGCQRATVRAMSSRHTSGTSSELVRGIQCRVEDLYGCGKCGGDRLYAATGCGQDASNEKRFAIPVNHLAASLNRFLLIQDVSKMSIEIPQIDIGDDNWVERLRATTAQFDPHYWDRFEPV